MKNVNSQAAELLTFVEILASKLDTNTAFDQCGNCMAIEPLVRHKAAVECEKNVSPFGLIDEYSARRCQGVPRRGHHGHGADHAPPP